MKIILASASPRRLEILRQIGLEFVIIPGNIEEKSAFTEPGAYVEEVSKEKALSAASGISEDAFIIGADTIVCLDGRLMGKPEDRDDAFNMIRALSGRTHQVYTGVTLVKKVTSREEAGIVRTFHEKTDVSVSLMDDDQIESYLDKGEYADKAGAYGIQGAFAAFVESINGDYYNVVGLPAARLVKELKVLGLKI